MPIDPSRRSARAALLVGALLLLPAAADAFCGFYVAKASTDLFNRASKVVLVRDGERTVMTLANDYHGDPTEFALVVPVPTLLEEGQIHVGERAVLEHLDAYSAPRLVEYHDPDPCAVRRYKEEMITLDSAAPQQRGADRGAAKKLGVTIEAEYTVGEYDILILSAKESDGLETWLRRNDYKIPEGASKVLASYIAQGMRFFVAKVNLEEQSKLGFTFLRPLQIAYEWDRFMLPIRLGMLNADGPQELFLFVLNRTGRVEARNYRTVKLPTDIELPGFIDEDFGNFYRDMFTRQAEKENLETIFLEYAWNMNWCDPCAADPLDDRELRDLGVFWLDAPIPPPTPRRDPRLMPPAPRDVYITRLHMRYTEASFPEDLMLRSTTDVGNFQGRYILHRPWTGDPNACPAARQYFTDLDRRRRGWAENLASLTGWELAEIHRRMHLGDKPPPADDVPWWKRLWKNDGDGGDDDDGT